MASASSSSSTKKKQHVIIVGAGPAGLFCALELLSSKNYRVTILERGEKVERRGRDIGALIHRKSLSADSNFCFGEGGAGTFSDGKLTTRIGRNSQAVRHVLETFVKYGAPSKILVDGAPHLGTENLVRLLRNMRMDLMDTGDVTIRFGTKMMALDVENDGVVSAVQVQSSSASTSQQKQYETIQADAVILATGHSARDVYEQLYKCGVKLQPKGFAVGFRVEHPQALINQIQYGNEWGSRVITGKKTTDTKNLSHFASTTNQQQQHTGLLPVASYRLATNQAWDGTRNRGVYSFCMCPGGQIVPCSTNPTELCVNGMSFSRRDSPFANSALVVTIDPNDELLLPYYEQQQDSTLAGLSFQRQMEQKAATYGGGNLVVPVQRLTDFLQNKPSTTHPPSSYRLGVKPTSCHEIYPPPIISAMQYALLNVFENQMPGFVCEDGLLHGVETRTSSPVRVVRDNATFQALGVSRLFPAGEGAGFAGGIVSAAVDGMMVASAVMREFGDVNQHDYVVSNKKKSVGFDY